MNDTPLSPELIAAGARRGRERAPDSVTVEWLAKQSSQLERVLRLQYPDRELPDEWEMELRRMPGEDTTTALQRWAYLKHLFRLRSEDWVRRGGESGDAAAAMDQLLRREPVVVQVCGERVEVTGRSYAAMAEMAAHGLAYDRAMADAERARDLFERVYESYGLRGRWRHRRRLRLLQRAHQVAHSEAEAHRRAFWAHALTPDGAPATDPARDAPEWWTRIGPRERAVLMSALFDVGPERAAKVPPSGDGPKKGDDGDRFGALSLMAAWGLRTKVEPAAVLHRDYGQVIGEMVAYAETRAGLDEDDLEYL